MSGIQGAWPGGPRQADHRKAPGRAWRLESLEDRADRVADRAKSRRTQKRGNQILSLLAVAAVVAGITGFTLGRSSGRSAADVAAALEAPEPSEGGLEEFLASEGTRVIRNMWLSEILEQQR